MVEKTGQIEGYITSIQKTLANIFEISTVLTEEVIRFKPSKEEWSIIQILSHINEAIPYWLGEIQRVVEKPGVEWGRGLQDAARLEAVADPDSLSTDVVLSRIKQQRKKIEMVLSQLTDEQLAIESPHRNFAKFGKKPVSFIISHFIDEHLAGHFEQIKRNLSKL